MKEIKDLNYQIIKDMKLYNHPYPFNVDELASEIKISKNTLLKVLNGNEPSDEILEKFYSFIYEKGYRINEIKEEFEKEKNNCLILFHGSKYGLSDISVNGSRANCDFGNGFYLKESYEQASSFIVDIDKSSVYSFKCDISTLNILELSCSLEWMIAICYYRGRISQYKNSKLVTNIINNIEKADIIITPIANNKIYYVMDQFVDGQINDEVALHSLSASGLGKQYVFKSKKAIDRLIPIERYYISNPERKHIINKLMDRVHVIDSKLKMAKREFRDGVFIEELFK